ncbi:MAG: peptidylprolyl isomerase [Gammaproteobacteria bacterium]|nr:peptidylprolyl isomerase [Gammaproteobacteria bacterium]
MKKALLYSLLFFSALFYAMNCIAKTTDQSLDQIVAIVNDDVVTRSELNQTLAIMKMQVAQSHMMAPPKEELQKQALEQLIDKKLQLQIAKQAGVEITNTDLEKAIELIAERNQVSVNTLYSHLAQEGMSVSDYRNEMYDQLVLQKLQQQEVISKITVTSEEINNFMHSKIWQTHAEKEYHIEDILIPFSDTPSTEEITHARIRANAVLAQLHQGKKFPEIARTEPKERALEENDLGWRQLPAIPSAFTDHVITMQANEIAGPIQASNGFHIIRLINLRNLATNHTTPDRKQVESLLMQRKFEEAVQNWVSKLRSQAYIEIKPLTSETA